MKNGAIHVWVTPIGFDRGMTSRIHTAGAALALTALVLAGCSKNAGISAERAIIDQLQEDIGLGELEPECGQPAALEEGETFTCTAATEDGQVIEFLGEMTGSDTFDVVTTNLLSAEDVVLLRQAGAEWLSQEVGDSVDPDAIVCPFDVIVLDDTGTFSCEVTDVSTNEVYEFLIMTGGLEPGEGIRDLGFELGDLLR